MIENTLLKRANGLLFYAHDGTGELYKEKILSGDMKGTKTLCTIYSGESEQYPWRLSREKLYTYWKAHNDSTKPLDSLFEKAKEYVRTLLLEKMSETDVQIVMSCHLDMHIEIFATLFNDTMSFQIEIIPVFNHADPDDFFSSKFIVRIPVTMMVRIALDDEEKEALGYFDKNDFLLTPNYSQLKYLAFGEIATHLGFSDPVLALKSREDELKIWNAFTTTTSVWYIRDQKWINHFLAYFVKTSFLKIDAVLSPAKIVSMYEKHPIFN